MPNEPRPDSHAELRRLAQTELLDRLFEGTPPREVRSRQAAHELSRRQASRAFRIQLFFVALATTAAVASAVAAVVSLASVRPAGGTGAEPSKRVEATAPIDVAREVMAAARYCALATVGEDGRPQVRAMDPFPPEKDLTVWLATNPRSRKVRQIEADPRVALYYFDPAGGAYATLHGRARLVDDPEEKQARWKEEWSAFYPDREAGYLLIEVTPERLEVVSEKHGLVGDPDTWAPSAVELGGVGVSRASPPVEGLYPVNGTELWVKRLGRGEPILVVHGGPLLEHGYLLPHLEPLADDHELIFFDQRLSGRSASEVEAGSVRLASFVDDIEALREALGLERVHLLAHSWGGLLAMHYAVRYPSRLRSLILLDSIAASTALRRLEEERTAERASPEHLARREALMATEGFAAGRPSAIADLLRHSFRLLFHDPAKVAALRLYVPDDYGERSRRLRELAGDLEDFDLHADLAGVEVPTLLVFGASEPGAAFGGAAIHAALPDSELVVIEDAGHFPFIERSDEFLRVVRRFLERR